MRTAAPKRLIVNFHGIGEPHCAVDDAERRSWCREDEFLSILDQIPQVSAEMQIPIELTFDDGNASDIHVAAPALQRRGLNATFFVCAGRIGRSPYLDAAQLRELAAAGMGIGSHGWDHVDWRRVSGPDALSREVQGARDFIAELMGGRLIEAVAIPFGSYDRRVARAATRSFSMVYTSDGGLAPLSGAVLPRESYTVRWARDTLRTLAAPPSTRRGLRRSLAMAYKWHRLPPFGSAPGTR